MTKCDTNYKSINTQASDQEITIKMKNCFHGNTYLA